MFMAVDVHGHTVSLYDHGQCVGRRLSNLDAIMDALGPPDAEKEALLSVAWDVVVPFQKSLTPRAG